MYRKKKILGLIPARGNSKGLPKKNIYPLLGKPLIAWTIETALKSKYLDRIVVSTDSGEIAKVSRKFGAEVPFLRPRELATDTAKSIDVVLHTLRFFQGQGLQFDYVSLLEPTSPLREESDIDKSIKLLVDNRYGAVSIVGVSRVVSSHPAFDVMLSDKNLLIPYEGDFSIGPRRQDLSKLYFLEGSIYVSQVQEIFKRRSFYHNKTLAYIVPKWKSPEVDDIIDLFYVEGILKNLDKIKRALIGF